MTAVLVAIAVLVGSGTLGLVTRRWPGFALAAGAAGAVIAAGLGLPPALGVLGGGASARLTFPWAVPAGELALGIDPLTAFFLVPLFVLAPLCAAYGFSYLRSHERRRALAPHALFLNVMVAAMAVVLVARHALLFLVAWEVMTLASYLLVTFEDEHAEARRAGWVYLVAAHLGVGFLVALFLILGRHAGSLGFAAFAGQSALSGPPALVVAALALLGFGVKAGVVPLHVWLPEAHAAAPSHVSALMSGMLIKLGVYGILRTLPLVALTSSRGPILMALGLGGALLGISLALYQRDIKRVLAYSSIENVGVILIGLGVGFWGLDAGHSSIAAAGICGALLHVWNHAAMKGLLFLAAGSLVHGAGSRDLERLGGLLRRMPGTGAAMIAGAVAIAGLPPLAGFASEWLIYMSLFEGGLAATSWAGLPVFLVAAGLAAVGALAVLCFVRLVGIALLGQGRSQAAREAHESDPGIVVPLLILALAVVALAFGAPALLRLVGPVAAQVAGPPLDVGVAISGVGWITTMNLVVLASIAAVAGVLVRLTRRRQAGDAVADDTWGCGYAAPTARMQYSGRSFAELAGEHLLPPPLRLRLILRRPHSLFPKEAGLSSDTTDPVTRAAYEPFFDRWARRFFRLRWLQQGALHAYLFYILAIVLIALVWASGWRWWLGS